MFSSLPDDQRLVKEAIFEILIIRLIIRVITLVNESASKQYFIYQGHLSTPHL